MLPQLSEVVQLRAPKLSPIKVAGARMTQTGTRFAFHRTAHPLANFENRISELSRDTSRDGWNDGRGKATDLRDWGRLHWITALVSIRRPHLPEPLLGAEGDGAVCVRWTTTTGINVLVELKGSSVWLTHVDGSGGGETITPSLTETIEAILHRLP